MDEACSGEVEDREAPFAERGVRGNGLRAEFVALVRQLGANRRALCQRFGIRWLGPSLGIGVRQAKHPPLASSAEGIGYVGPARDQPGAAM